MATVYLPFGYPKLSGLEYANVIYQGNVARLYTVPVDPRTDAQLQERRQFADLTKMRGTLGTWARKGLITAMGSRWSTVIFQLIKANEVSWWSGALEEWEDFTTGNKDAWRAAAPYQATYNDMGQIFFGLCRVIYSALMHFQGIGFGSALWDETESAAALTWWNKSIVGVFSASSYSGIYDENFQAFTFDGDWTTVTNGSAHNGAYKRLNDLTTGEMSFYFYGVGLDFYCPRAVGYGTGNLYLDGVLKYVVDLNYTGDDFNNFKVVASEVRGLHYCRFEHVGSGKLAFDYIRVFNQW